MTGRYTHATHLALTPGTRLGPYEITAQIGAGGMGAFGPASDRSETSCHGAGVGRLRAFGATASLAEALAEAGPRATRTK